jgi:hypothetical protein
MAAQAWLNRVSGFRSNSVLSDANTPPAIIARGY